MIDGERRTRSPILRNTKLLELLGFYCVSFISFLLLGYSCNQQGF